MSRNLVLLALPALAAATLLLSACGSSDNSDKTTAATTAAANAKNITITAKDFSFDNVNLSAKAGESVHLTLVNSGSTEHSFTINTVADVEAESGETQTTDFKAPSQTTEFHCKYHPTQMKGTLTISP